MSKKNVLICGATGYIGLQLTKLLCTHKKINIKFDDKELYSMKTPSYPSGHSVQGILVAEVLSDMYPKHAKAFKKIGKDISYSRNVAHAHYKSDSKFGEQIGKDMYEHIKNKI